MRTLKESILDGGADVAWDNVERREKIDWWLSRNAARVKGLKLNKDGSIDADEIRFIGKLGLGAQPGFINFNSIGVFAVKDCPRWNGALGYPRKCNKLYLNGLPLIKDLQDLGDSDIKWLILSECNGLHKDLKIPSNHHIQSVRIFRNHYGKYDQAYIKQFEDAGITIIP